MFRKLIKWIKDFGKRWLILFVVVVLIMGTAGFYQAGENLVDSLFLALVLFTLNYADHPANLLINISRYLAAATTVSAALVVIHEIFLHFADDMRARKKGSTLVLGPEEEVAPILDELGSLGITYKEKFVNAKRFILFGSDEENLGFYSRYEKRLADKEVYIKTDSLPGLLPGEGGLRFFCTEELAAQDFWRSYPLMEEAFEKAPSPDRISMDIVLLGFGRLGEEVLHYALQANLFHPAQKITYHVFGDSGKFARTHTQLKELRICVHENAWYEEADLLKHADRILVLDQEEQASLINELFSVSPDYKLYVFSAIDLDPSFLLQHRCGTIAEENLVMYPWKVKANTLGNIVAADLLKKAKRANFDYELQADPKLEDTEENMEKAWRGLNTFTRYSNLDLVYFNEIIRNLREHYKDMPREDFARLLAELQHMRWNNYHYFNNWSYDPEPNPGEPNRKKNAARRLHADLVPFDQLDESEIKKDIVAAGDLLK
ncbi:MAG: hypothetical protein K5682_07425 [Lachnospiraceae bacterium]|nr:hypothetical protein [Lachnospiraceae bacterium]